MTFNKFDKEIFHYEPNELEEIVEKDECYYQLIESLISLYREWGEEISFGEMRDIFIDKFFLDVNWTKSDWNKQIFRRLYIGKRMGHVYDERIDDDIFYSPTDEGIGFNLRRYFPLTYGSWAEGDKRRLDREKEEPLELEEDIEIEDSTPAAEITPEGIESPELDNVNEENEELREQLDDLRGLYDDLAKKFENINVREKEVQIPKQALETESMDLLSKLIVDNENTKNAEKQKIMIIDGSNVMVRRRSGKFSRMQSALKYCLEEKYNKITVICDANLKYKLDEQDRELFGQMLKGEMKRVTFQQSPAGTIADSFILTVANDWFKGGHEVKIMTNDLFRDFSNPEGENYNEEFAKLLLKEKVRLSFMFTDGPSGEQFYENPSED